MRLATAFPSNSAARSVRSSHLLPLFIPLFSSFSVTCNSRLVGLIHPTSLVRRKERRGREAIGGSRKEDEGSGGGGSSAEWNPFRNCKPPCSIPSLPRLSPRIPTPSLGLFPVPSLRKSYSPSALGSSSRLTFSLSLSPSPFPLLFLSFPIVLSLSRGSVLASNTDIEQSPFSLKPSSHQE